MPGSSESSESTDHRNLVKRADNQFIRLSEDVAEIGQAGRVPYPSSNRSKLS